MKPTKPPTLKRDAPLGESESNYTNIGDMEGEADTTSEAGHDGHG